MDADQVRHQCFAESYIVWVYGVKFAVKITLHNPSPIVVTECAFELVK